MAGRGRGRSATKQTSPSSDLRRPGQHPSPSEAETIVQRIQDMSVPMSPQKMREVVEEIKNSCANEESLRNIISVLHTKSLEDEDFGNKASCVFGELSQFGVAKVKFRDILLKLIQSDFKAKETLVAEDYPRFLNSVSLLCQVFQNVTLSDGAVINVLAKPILECMGMILSSPRNDGIALFGKQIQILGSELKLHESTRWVDLIVAIRRCIVESSLERLSSESKATLLFLVESDRNLPAKVDQFYLDAMPHNSRYKAVQLTNNAKESPKSAQPERTSEPPAPQYNQPVPPNHPNHHPGDPDQVLRDNLERLAVVSNFLSPDHQPQSQFPDHPRQFPDLSVPPPKQNWGDGGPSGPHGGPSGPHGGPSGSHGGPSGPPPKQNWGEGGPPKQNWSDGGPPKQNWGDGGSSGGWQSMPPSAQGTEMWNRGSASRQESWGSDPGRWTRSPPPPQQQNGNWSNKPSPRHHNNGWQPRPAPSVSPQNNGNGWTGHPVTRPNGWSEKRSDSGEWGGTFEATKDSSNWGHSSSSSNSGGGRTASPTGWGSRGPTSEAPKDSRASNWGPSSNSSSGGRPASPTAWGASRGPTSDAQWGSNGGRTASPTGWGGGRESRPEAIDASSVEVAGWGKPDSKPWGGDGWGAECASLPQDNEW